MFSWQFYNVLKFGSVIFTAILMAKFIPDIQIIKTYESLILIGSTLSFFYISGLGQTVIPYYESSTSENKNKVFKQLFQSLSLLAFGTGILLMVYAYLFKADELNLYFLFALATLFNIPSFALESYFLAHQKHKALLIWGAIGFSFQIIVLILPTLYYNNLIYGIFGLFLFSFLKFAASIYVLKIKTLKINFVEILNFNQYSAPVMLSFLIGGSYVYLNAFVVEYFLSDRDFVLYRFGAREFPLFLIIANSFSLVYSGKIASGISKGNLNNTLIDFKLQNKKILHQLFPLAILLMLISKPIFSFLYSSQTQDAYLVFNLLLFLLLSRVLFPQTILFGLQKSKVFITASALELITGIVLSLILVSDFGLKGVCWAMIVAFLVEKLYLIVKCYQNKIPFFKHFPTNLYLIYSILLGISYCISLEF